MADQKTYTTYTIKTWDTSTTLNQLPSWDGMKVYYESLMLERAKNVLFTNTVNGVFIGKPKPKTLRNMW